MPPRVGHFARVRSPGREDAARNPRVRLPRQAGESCPFPVRPRPGSRPAASRAGPNRRRQRSPSAHDRDPRTARPCPQRTKGHQPVQIRRGPEPATRSRAGDPRVVRLAPVLTGGATPGHPARPARGGRRGQRRQDRPEPAPRRRLDDDVELSRARSPIADRGLAIACPRARAGRSAAHLVALDTGAPGRLLRRDAGRPRPRPARPAHVGRRGRGHRPRLGRPPSHPRRGPRRTGSARGRPGSLPDDHPRRDHGRTR